MKSHTIIFFFILIIASQYSCTQKIDEKVVPPADLLPKEEMIDILTDFEIYDALMMTKQKNDRIHFEYDKLYFYNSILEKYNITRDRFQRSYTYYQEDHKQMDAIYEDVLTKLSKMKTETESGND